jgi:hypothetical protein
MGEVLRQVETSGTFLEFVQSKVETCFLCKWIRQDLEQHGKLTGWPLDSFNKPEFPIDAKLVHVLLEMGEIPPEDPEDDEVVASAVAKLFEI